MGAILPDIIRLELARVGWQLPARGAEGHARAAAELVVLLCLALHVVSYALWFAVQDNHALVYAVFAEDRIVE